MSDSNESHNSVFSLFDGSDDERPESPVPEVEQLAIADPPPPTTTDPHLTINGVYYPISNLARIAWRLPELMEERHDFIPDEVTPICILPSAAFVTYNPEADATLDENVPELVERVFEDEIEQWATMNRQGTGFIQLMDRAVATIAREDAEIAIQQQQLQEEEEVIHATCVVCSIEYEGYLNDDDFSDLWCHNCHYAIQSNISNDVFRYEFRDNDNISEFHPIDGRYEGGAGVTWTVDMQQRVVMGSVHILHSSLMEWRQLECHTCFCTFETRIRDNGAYNCYSCAAGIARRGRGILTE